MDWNKYLQENEKLCWSGRPAPRCFTFRHWIHSVFGLLLFFPALVWLDGGQALAASRNEAIWAVIPWFGIALALYFLLGHLLKARIEWEKTFYAITDQRLLVQGGWPRTGLRELPLSTLRHFKLKPKGAHLGSLLISGSEPKERVALTCLEHPELAVQLLEQAVQVNLGREPAPETND